MKITLYGTNYVALVTGACLAQVGNDVLCIDQDIEHIKRLNNADIDYFEPGLKQLTQENLSAGRLSFSDSFAEGVEHGLYQFIASKAPIDEKGKTNTDKLLHIARTIGENLDRYKIIITKSTAPVGTSHLIKEIIDAQLAQRDIALEFDVISNPEFIKVGEAIDNFMRPDRIIIGSDNPRTTELMRELYAPFNHNRDRIVAMDVRSAEITKYAANALLATKVSFMNELSNIAERCGADIEQVRLGIGSDPRIGYHYIYPGCGYGGPRFPTAIRALSFSADQADYSPELLNAVENVNQRQKSQLFNKLTQHFGKQLSDKTIALWGLAFKPNSSDIQGSASSVLMEQLWQAGAKVRAYDPAATDNCRTTYGNKPDLHLCNSANDALQGADALVIVTGWQEFRSPDFTKIKESLNNPVIVDGRNLYQPEQMQSLGFHYYSIGRSHHAAK